MMGDRWYLFDDEQSVKVKYTDEVIRERLNFISIIKGIFTYIIYLFFSQIVKYPIRNYALSLYYGESQLEYPIIQEINLILNFTLIIIVIYLMIPKSKEYISEWGNEFFEIYNFISIIIYIIFSMDFSVLVYYLLSNHSNTLLGLEVYYTPDIIWIKIYEIIISLVVLLVMVSLIKVYYYVKLNNPL